MGLFLNVSTTVDRKPPLAFRPCWWKTFRSKRGERKRERKEKKEEGKKEKKEEEIEDRRHWEIVNICQLRINTCIMQ